jgi:hypothetical protein
MKLKKGQDKKYEEFHTKNTKEEKLTKKRKEGVFVLKLCVVCAGF